MKKYYVTLKLQTKELYTYIKIENTMARRILMRTQQARRPTTWSRAKRRRIRYPVLRLWAQNTINKNTDAFEITEFCKAEMVRFFSLLYATEALARRLCRNCV